MHAPTCVVSNDAALRIKAAHLGLQAEEHRPVGRSMSTRPAGWGTFEAAHEAIDCLYAAGAIAVDSIPTCSAAPRERIRRASRRIAVGIGPPRRRRPRCCCTHNAPEAWGLRARSKEQRFALELLLDPDVSVVALDGRAGTGKTLLAIAAGLEQVVESHVGTSASPSTAR